MERPCEQCGTPFVAKRPSARFCSDRCRKRQARGAPPMAAAPAPVAAPTGDLEGATLRELTAAGRADTALGLAALELARRVTRPGEPGAAVAALVKALRETLTEALAGAQQAADPLDELRRRRDEKRTAAG